MKIQNYVLKDDYPPFESGTYVKPLNPDYLPRHIKDQMWHWFNPEIQVFCYTPKGIMLIPKKLIVKDD